MRNTELNLKYLSVAFIAAVAGAAIGVLFAPASGRETRRMLSRKARETREDLLRKGERAIGRLTERVEHGLDEGKKKLAHVAGL